MQHFDITEHYDSVALCNHSAPFQNHKLYCIIIVFYCFITALHCAITNRDCNTTVLHCIATLLNCQITMFHNFTIYHFYDYSALYHHHDPFLMPSQHSIVLSNSYYDITVLHCIFIRTHCFIRMFHHFITMYICDNTSQNRIGWNKLTLKKEPKI